MSRFTVRLKNRVVLLGAAAAIALGGAGIALSGGEGAHAEPAAAAAAPSVGVQTVSARPVQVWAEFSGRMHAVDFAEIRPEVGGRITEVRIRDGQTVKAGDILFVIDPRPYDAAVAKARANVASANTNVAFAKIELERAANMVKTQAVAQRLYDERANAERVAAAAVLVADAELKQAEIDLDHAFVKAPIAGRISRAEITLGNLVQPGPTAPVLTSIVSTNGIYADFDVDEQTYLQSIRAQASTQDKERRIPVRLAVQGEREHAYEGTISSFDNQINTATGTIRARARFDNADGSLMPGMFVSVKVASGGERQSLLVPERAIGNDQDKKFVYVVGDDGKVAYRSVNLGQHVDGQRIVLTGLSDGERVIVDGLQHVRPAMTVQVRQASLISGEAEAGVARAN